MGRIFNPSRPVAQGGFLTRPASCTRRRAMLYCRLWPLEFREDEYAERRRQGCGAAARPRDLQRSARAVWRGDSGMLRKIADVAEKYRVPMIKITSARPDRPARRPRGGCRRRLGRPGNGAGQRGRHLRPQHQGLPRHHLVQARQMDGLGLGMIFDEKYHGMELPGKMKIGVSGCPNQCGETSFKDIGWWSARQGQVYVGGNGGTNPPPASARSLPSGSTATRRWPSSTDPRILPRLNAKPREHGSDDRALGLDHMEDALGLSET